MAGVRWAQVRGLGGTEALARAVAATRLGRELANEDFWETVLFRTGAYRRNALQVHVALHARHPLTGEHFARWLELWDGTVDALYAGPIAERAKLQAARIAGSMERRLAGRSGSAFETLSRHEA